jgi:hypothetical protein
MAYPWSIEMDASVQRLNFVTAGTGPVFAGADIDLHTIAVRIKLAKQERALTPPTVRFVSAGTAAAYPTRPERAVMAKKTFILESDW